MVRGDLAEGSGSGAGITGMESSIGLGWVYG